MNIFPISPGLVLGVLIALTSLAALIEGVSRRRWKRRLRQLASLWRMNYSPDDQLRVATRIAGRFPVPGAADMHVMDLIYGAQGEQYRYVFTAEYTIGVIRGKRRQVCVATFSEPRDRRSADLPTPVTLAPEDLPLLEQYQRLAPARPVSVSAGGEDFSR